MGLRLMQLSDAFGKTLMTTVGMTAISFISSVLTARMLGPEGRGLLSGALLIGTLAAGVAQLGLANSYVYHFGALRAFPYLRLLVWSVIGSATFACALAWGAVQLSSEGQLHRASACILALAVCMSVQTYFLALAQLKPDLHFFNMMRLGLVLGNLLLLLPIVSIFDRVTFHQLLSAQLLVLAASGCGAVVWSRQHRVWQMPAGGLQTTSIGQLVGYGLQQHGTVLLGLLLLNFDKVILLHRGNIEEYGYYALAFTTSRLIGAVQDAASVALYAGFAGKDVVQLGDKVKTAFRLTFLPLLSMAALGAALSPWLIVWVYGDKFASMVLPFSILLFECVIGGASWTLAQRFNAGGRPGLVLVRQCISVIPVFAAMPFLPQQNAHVSLALLMLAGAVLRLGVTMILYPTSLKEPIPHIVPTLCDYRMVRAWLLRSKVARRAPPDQER